MANATPNLGFQNKFSTTLTTGIVASDTTIPLTALPAPTEGYLVIEPDSSTAWEVIYYTSKTGSAVVCPSAGAGRGVGGSTAASHSGGATVRMDSTADMFSSLQDGTALTKGGITPEKLLSGAGTSWVWQSYVPTFTNVSGGTLNYAKYIQIGKMITVRFKYTLAGAGMGTSPTMSLPVTANADLGESDTGAGLLGDIRLIDAGNTYYIGVVTQASTTTVKFRNVDASGTYANATGITSTLPFTWGNGDFIQGFITYEAA